MSDFAVALVCGLIVGVTTYFVARDYQWSRDGKLLAEETEQWLAYGARR